MPPAKVFASGADISVALMNVRKALQSPVRSHTHPPSCLNTHVCDAWRAGVDVFLKGRLVRGGPGDFAQPNILAIELENLLPVLRYMQVLMSF